MLSTAITKLKQNLKLVTVTTIGLVIGGATTSVVLAAVPDPNGVIHACYTTAKVKIIDSATQTCANNETAITWNQQGPKGDTGNTGPTGPQGPAGPGSVGGALAYAYVDINGQLNPTMSYNIANYYLEPDYLSGCFTINPAPKNAIVSGNAHSDIDQFSVRTSYEGPNSIPAPPTCPAGTNAFVSYKTGSGTGRSYYVLFH